jgi:hypothetical protein
MQGITGLLCWSPQLVSLEITVEVQTGADQGVAPESLSSWASCFLGSHGLQTESLDFFPFSKSVAFR